MGGDPCPVETGGFGAGAEQPGDDVAGDGFETDAAGPDAGEQRPGIVAT
jgi:hypothetical protein